MDNDGYDTGLAKCEQRRLMIQQLGKKVEDLELALDKDKLRFEGAVNALDEAIQYIEKHRRWWEQELKEGKCSQQECDAAIKSINQCAGICRNASAKIKNQQTVASGKKEAYTTVLDIFEREFNEEEKRGKQIAEYLRLVALKDEADQRPLNRPPGVHPGNKLAKRKAKKKSNAKKVAQAS